MLTLARGFILLLVLLSTAFAQVKVRADWPECPISNGDNYSRHRGDSIVIYTDRKPLRKQPDEISTQVATLHDGDLLTVISEATCPFGEDEPRYYQVVAKSGLTGWILEDGVYPFSPADPAYHVNGMTFTPDAKYLLVSVGDTTVWLWDVRGNKKVRKVLAGGSIFGIAQSVDAVFTADGKFFLAIDSGAKTFSLYDAKTSKRVRTFSGHEAAINSIALAPDERYALSGSGDISGSDMPDTTARLWDVQTGEQLKVFRGNDFVSIHKVLFSPDSQFIFVDPGPFVVQYELKTFKEVRRYKGGSPIAISPDGKQILMTGRDSLIMYDTGTGDSIHSYPSRWMTGVVFTRDGKYFASYGADGLTLWDAKTTQQIRKFKEPAQSELKSADPLLVSPDERYLYTGSASSGVVMVWDIATGSLVRTLSMYQQR